MNVFDLKATVELVIFFFFISLENHWNNECDMHLAKRALVLIHVAHTKQYIICA